MSVQHITAFGIRTSRAPEFQIYKRILALLPGIMAWQVERTTRLKAEGFMDLVVEAIGRGQDQFGKYVDISLAHYYKQNGDLMADPEMAVRLYKHGWATSLHYQLDGLGLYWPSFFDADITRRTTKATENNTFLVSWLKNLEAQGHRGAANLGDAAAARTAAVTRAGA